jgi:tRNA A-37 threonylcarbamoyl transferase component Bud32
MDKKYKVLSQLGNKGKEARTFLVEDKFKCTYAGKQFRKNKSSQKIMEEVDLQRKCSATLISPKIVDYNLKSKYIIMETMDGHLYNMIVENGGQLSDKYQKEIVKLLKTLDKIGIYQGDPNLLNYMLKDKKIYMIDFGSVKIIDDTLIKSLKTKKPNMEIVLLAFILKMKAIGFPSSSYKYMAKFLTPERQKILIT